MKLQRPDLSGGAKLPDFEPRGTQLTYEARVAAALEEKLGGYERACLRPSQVPVPEFEKLGIKVLGRKLFPDIDDSTMILPSEEQLKFVAGLSPEERKQVVLVAVPPKMNARSLAETYPNHVYADSNCYKVWYERAKGHYEMLIGDGAELAGSVGLLELDQIQLLADREFTASPAAVFIADLESRKEGKGMESRFVKKDWLRVPTLSDPGLVHCSFFSNRLYLNQVDSRSQYFSLALAASRE